MNVFTRFWTVVKSHINAWINKLEKPERVLEQSLRDMQNQVNRMRGDVVKVLAEEKKLKNQVDKYHEEIGRWEKNAVLALKEGNEELAREALRRKREAVQFTQQLQPQCEQQQVIAEKLRGEYQQLQQRIQEAQRRKRTLVTRLRHAESQKRLQGLLTDLSDNHLFERFESKLLEMEAMNDVQTELRQNSLEEKFDALSSGGSGNMDVDQELEVLKEQMKLNP